MIREFTCSDVEELNVQSKQAGYKAHVQNFASSGDIGTVFTYLENGKPKAIVGAQEHWKGRCAVWALIGDVDNWITLHKDVTRALDEYANKNRANRLELTTEFNFSESERWARMLGFKQESVMKAFGIHGEDHKMWVKLYGGITVSTRSS